MQPIKELSSAAGRCAGSGCKLIMQLANTSSSRFGRIRTPVVSVGELDAVDVQCRSQVNRPPRVCLCSRTHTGSVYQVRAVVAVVTVGSTVSAIGIAVRTGLERRTIQSHVHVEASIHRHCTQHHVVALTEVIEINEFNLLCDKPRHAIALLVLRCNVTNLCWPNMYTVRNKTAPFNFCNDFVKSTYIRKIIGLHIFR